MPAVGIQIQLEICTETFRVGISPYIDQVYWIIRDLLPHFFRKGTEIHHLFQAERPIPLLLAKI